MSVRPRILGLALVVCGVLIATLPALPWYAVTFPTGASSLSGYGAGAAAWLLPPIGASLVVTGVLAAWWAAPTGTPPVRALGAVAVLAAVLGMGWSAFLALAPHVEVVAVRAGMADSPVAGEWFIGVLPPAWACLAATALAGMAGILLLVPGTGPAPPA